MTDITTPLAPIVFGTPAWEVLVHKHVPSYLLDRVCAAERCATTFRPVRPTHKYCSAACALWDSRRRAAGRRAA